MALLPRGRVALPLLDSSPPLVRPRYVSHTSNSVSARVFEANECPPNAIGCSEARLIDHSELELANANIDHSTPLDGSALAGIVAVSVIVLATLVFCIFCAIRGRSYASSSASSLVRPAHHNHSSVTSRTSFKVIPPSLIVQPASPLKGSEKPSRPLRPDEHQVHSVWLPTSDYDRVLAPHLNQMLATCLTPEHLSIITERSMEMSVGDSNSVLGTKSSSLLSPKSSANYI
ncbi:hypothetical protein BKA62DRAFT_685645 [Auriculariales sp. MPI-PUGE-AT-0066]|nr:hypothetical protein BKA62DRAFT_685645 [Auriculariales sp. MPI-PUGE-AT-0066]